MGLSFLQTTTLLKCWHWKLKLSFLQTTALLKCWHLKLNLSTNRHPRPQIYCSLKPKQLTKHYLMEKRRIRPKDPKKMDIDESIFNQATQLSIANENDNESNASKDLLTEDLVGGDNDDGNETDSSLDLIPNSQEETQMIRPFWAKQSSLSTVQEEPIASTSNIVDKAVSNPEMEQVKKKEEEESNHEEETELNDSFDLLATTQSLVGSGDEGNNNDNEEEEEEEDEHKGTVPEGIVLRERNDLENEKREASETESNDDYFVEADEDRLDFDLDEDLEETDNKKPTGHKNSDTAPIPTKDIRCEEETVKELETARVI